jgi:hypothetical protein
MRLNQRLAKLTKKLAKPTTVEIIFREMGESYVEAVKRGREKFPNVDKLIIVSWIQP